MKAEAGLHLRGANWLSWPERNCFLGAKALGSSAWRLYTLPQLEVSYPGIPTLQDFSTEGPQGMLYYVMLCYISQPKSSFTCEENGGLEQCHHTAKVTPCSWSLKAWEIWFLYGVCLRTFPDVSIKAQRHTSPRFPERLFSNTDVFTNTGRRAQDHRKAD